MKIKFMQSMSFSFIAATVFLMGCATTGYQKASSTAKALTKSSETIAKGNMLIDDTLTKLNDLVSNPGLDLRKQFAAFNKSVDELAATAENVSVEADQMKLQGADYFKNWDNEVATIKNEDIRHRSQERKDEVSSSFERISQRYDETKAAFLPYMAKMRDVQKFLATDLTSGGLEAIKDVVKEANEDAVPLKESLTKLSQEFNNLGLSMSTKRSVSP